MMDAAQHKLSRRALLAGVCAGAVPLSRHPELVSGSSWMGAGAVEDWTPDQVRGDGERSDEKWHHALARYDRAVAGLEAVAHTEDDRLYDRALGRHNAALARLLRTPAPGLAAVAAKLDLILEHQVFELTFGEAALEALRGDLGRMAG